MNVITESLNECGWIYICIDLRDPLSFKVGLTKTNNIFQRMSDTTNPYYMLVRGYKIPDNYINNLDCKHRSFRTSDWYYLERYIHKELEKGNDRINHCMTGKESEWFEGDLEGAIGEIDYYFARTVELLDEDGNHDIRPHIYDPIINTMFFYEKLYRFMERNIYIKKIHDHFNECDLSSYSNTNITLTSVLDIPYVT